MGRPGYPAEFRRKVLDLLAEGRSVASVAHDLDVSDQTIYNWRRQDRIDRGEQPGLTRSEEHTSELQSLMRTLCPYTTRCRACPGGAGGVGVSWVPRSSSFWLLVPDTRRVRWEDRVIQPSSDSRSSTCLPKCGASLASRTISTSATRRSTTGAAKTVSIAASSPV